MHDTAYREWRQLRSDDPSSQGRPPPVGAAYWSTGKDWSKHDYLVTLCRSRGLYPSNQSEQHSLALIRALQLDDAWNGIRPQHIPIGSEVAGHGGIDLRDRARDAGMVLQRHATAAELRNTLQNSDEVTDEDKLQLEGMRHSELEKRAKQLEIETRWTAPIEETKEYLEDLRSRGDNVVPIPAGEAAQHSEFITHQTSNGGMRGDEMRSVASILPLKETLSQPARLVAVFCVDRMRLKCQSTLRGRCIMGRSAQMRSTAIQ